MTTFILSSLITGQQSGFFRNALATLRTWQARSRARSELARFNERDLHDIGLSWSGISEEVNKPFWRE
jgi:uncharacterized protein YjiS (DUF1127 family)